MANNSATPREQEIHDKLRDQISVSIEESLAKATAVLSGLHRVHSYLEILKTLPMAGGEGAKGALEQVRDVRTETAALLQTIYLTEIGLQSLEKVNKLPLATSSAGDVTVVPLIADAIDVPELSGDVVDDDDDAINSNGDDVMGNRTLVEQENQSEISEPLLATSSEPLSEESAPPPKRMNFGVIITRCLVCKRKYATDWVDPNLGSKCKTCRSRETPTNQSPVRNQPMTSDPILVSSAPHRPSPQEGPKSKLRRLSNAPMSCKVCGTSFVYRRCLFRHLRENHPGIDLNNIAEYIESEASSNEETRVPEECGDTSVTATTKPDVPGSSDVDDGSILGTVASLAGGGGVLRSGEGILDSTMKQVYTCTICNKVFDRPYRLTRHLNVHDPNRPRVSCHVCERTFTRLDTLENHVKSVHAGDRPFHCEFSSCQKSFVSQTALMNHLKVHTNGKPYQCQECDAAFSLLLEYKTHARAKHPETERLRCGHCHRVFPDVVTLEEHRSVEHLLECEICGKRFARLAYLQLHIKVHDGESVFNCGVCSQGFESVGAYRHHIKTHPKPGRGGRFHCQLCDRDFEAPSELIAHHRCEEHREKAMALGLAANTTILNTIEGDLSDMSALVDEVAMGTTSIAMETGSVVMETTPVSMTTTGDPKGSLDVTPGVLATTNIISSAIARGTSFQT